MQMPESCELESYLRILALNAALEATRSSSAQGKVLANEFRRIEQLVRAADHPAAITALRQIEAAIVPTDPGSA